MGLFLSRESLSHRYVPDRLPHRERELELVSRLLGDEGSETPVVLRLEGPVGVGKTSVAKLALRKAGRKLVYVNMKLEGSNSFSLFSSMLRKVEPGAPVRSLSPGEIFMAFLRSLEKRRTEVVLVLDEVDYFIRTTKDHGVVYAVTRVHEIGSRWLRGVVMIARDPRWRSRLDPAERSSLGELVIPFGRYDRSQIYDILEYRTQGAFRRGVVPSEVLEYVSDITFNYASSDLRFALDLLLYAGVLAEAEDAGKVALDHVRRALSYIDPAITSADIESLGEDERFALLALTRALRLRQAYRVGLEDVWEEYQAILEQYGRRKPGRRRFESALQKLYDRGLVDVDGVSRIGISRVPLDKLNTVLDAIIARIS